MSEPMGIKNGVFYIGASKFPTAVVELEDTDFTEITDELDQELVLRVFNTPNPVARVRRATFVSPNGWEISIIWGTNAMSENYNVGLMDNGEFSEEVFSVEIGICHTEFDFHVNPDNGNIGAGRWVEDYVYSDRVRMMILFAAGLEEVSQRPEQIPELEEEQYEYSEDIPDEDF